MADHKRKLREFLTTSLQQARVTAAATEEALRALDEEEQHAISDAVVGDDLTGAQHVTEPARIDQLRQHRRLELTHILQTPAGDEVEEGSLFVPLNVTTGHAKKRRERVSSEPTVEQELALHGASEVSGSLTTIGPAHSTMKAGGVPRGGVSTRGNNNITLIDISGTHKETCPLAHDQSNGLIQVKPSKLSDADWAVASRDRKLGLTHVHYMVEADFGMKAASACEHCVEIGESAFCTVYKPAVRLAHYGPGKGYKCSTCVENVLMCSFSPWAADKRANRKDSLAKRHAECVNGDGME
ncbi:hypothetical protein B0A48_12126 [Cryoendolithus antarcticus]|uniref:Uncharacterized protein n=1 Tax=Cryoendolithus antarcticus TaxID=1507870 RepID=A0A1V8SUC3_9PEZI|nr:hypothetical protein B0A48_12126 [Cryoendolithus antarcticus]